MEIDNLYDAAFLLVKNDLTEVEHQARKMQNGKYHVEFIFDDTTMNHYMLDRKYKGIDDLVSITKLEIALEYLKSIIIAYNKGRIYE